MSIDKKVLSAFNEIFEGCLEDENVQEALLLLGKCYDPNTPSHEIKFYRAGNVLRRTHRLFIEKDDFWKRVKPLITSVQTHLRDLGYESDIYTMQEQRLAGGSAEPPYDQNPYVPLGVLKGTISIEQANKARQLERRHQALGVFFIKADHLVDISLEPLTKEGLAVRDPVLLDSALKPIPTSYAKDFPYLRCQ